MAFVAAQERPSLSPDGRYYREDPWKRPYAARRLCSWLMRKAPEKTWRAFTLASLATASFASGMAAGSPWACALVACLPLSRVCARFPVLTDAPALACLGLAVWLKEPWVAALGGLFNEKCPVFGALALWSAVPLAGLAVPLALWARGKAPGPGDPAWLRHPVREAARLSRRFFDPRATIAPWGGLLAGVGGLSWQGALALALGYSQLLAAQDCARLYSWAFFPLLLGVPANLLPAAAAASLAFPYKGV